MGYYIAQAGTALYRVTTSSAKTLLTLPTGVSLSSSRRPRFAQLGDSIIVTNSPSRNIRVLKDGTVIPLCLQPPAAPISVSGSSPAATAVKAAVSFQIRDTKTDRLLCESPLGPPSANAVTTFPTLANAPISPDSNVTHRAVYITEDGGSLYYQWVLVTGNLITVPWTAGMHSTFGSASILPVQDNIGVAPGTIDGYYLTNIVSWKNRLWAVSDIPGKQDAIRYTEDGLCYAWPEDNEFTIDSTGLDARGITAFMARRDELGIGRRDLLAKIVGSSDDDFSVVVVSKGIGPAGADCGVVIKDVGYFLGMDGVYRWDGSGVSSISVDSVHPWFTTSTYFNRSQFPNAVLSYDPVINALVINLCAAGSTSLDRWIHYTLDDGKWWGPHTTGAFTPTYATTLQDSNGLAYHAMTGFDGRIYATGVNDTAGFGDGPNGSPSFAVDMDVTTKPLHGGDPDLTHYFGQPTILSKITTGNLTVTPSVGGLDASAGSALTHDLTTGRQRLARLGVGRTAKLRLRSNTTTEARIYGVELPYHVIGRR